MKYVFVDNCQAKIIWIQKLETDNIIVKVEPMQENDNEIKEYINYNNNTYILSHLLKKDVYWYCNFKPILHKN